MGGEEEVVCWFPELFFSELLELVFDALDILLGRFVEDKEGREFCLFIGAF